jgi:hypothetical protein
MLLSALFRRLSFGELSNLAISNSGSGTIVEAKYPQLIQYVNTALIDIFTRFVLSEKEVIIEQVEGLTMYHLLAKHSATVGTEVNKYIIDSEEDTFRDDIAIRIREVWGVANPTNPAEDDEVEEDPIKFPLNDAEHDYSLFTPSPLSLQVPEPVAGEPLSIIYQAYHPPLVDEEDEEVTELLDQVIDIPHYLDNALTKRVASEVFSHMNGQENILKGQEYLAAYEKACFEIEERDLANQSAHTSHDKLEQRGFV